MKYTNDQKEENKSQEERTVGCLSRASAEAVLIRTAFLGAVRSGKSLFVPWEGPFLLGDSKT